MLYPDIREYITFLFSMLDVFSISEEKVAKSGRPQTYPDASLIVFYAVMALKGIAAMRAQQTYLFHHPLMLERCQLPACPTHVTLGRRYKALTPKLQTFTEYVATSSFAKTTGFLLIEKGMRCIVADNGYIDKKRIAAFAEVGVLLLTPKTTLTEATPPLRGRLFVYRNTNRNMAGNTKNCH